MNKHKRNAIVGSVTLLLLGACSGPVTPDKPTWEADIYPILQGQCLNCHGATSNKTGPAFRFDFFDLDKCKDIGPPPPDLELDTPNGWTWRGAIADDVKPQLRTNEGRVVETFRPRMPPAPASLLEDWQVETIAKWSKRSKEDARGKRPSNRNRLPTIRITSELPESTDSELTVSFVVEDGDDDPVIGLLKIGDQSHYINSAGLGEHTFDLSGESNGELTITANLCDGWEQQPFDDLGKVEKE